MTKEEVLFSAFDSGWQRELPVTLIEYKDGTLDLHRQTGSNWDEAIERAEGILKERGLILKTKEPETIGPSGGYMTVERIAGHASSQTQSPSEDK